MNNNTLKMIGISVGSFVFGGGAGTLITKKIIKKKYDKKMDEEVSKMELWYQKRVTEIYEKVRSSYDSTDNDESVNEALKKREMTVSEDESDEKAEETEVSQKMNSKEMKEIREKLKSNWDRTTNYAAMYQVEKKKDDDLNPIYGDIADGPQDDDPEEEEFSEEDKKTKALHEAHQKTKNRPPKIISAEAVADLPPTVDLVSLMYYQDNDVLVTENDEIIDDPGNYVGDCLTKYGFDENTEETIYVMNYSLDVAYEIQKVFSSYNFD